MRYTIRDLQARLRAWGYDAGPVDNLDGPKTRQATNQAMRDRGVKTRDDLFHRSGLHRVVMHWTAGAYGDIALERRAYHLLVLEDGKVVMGDYAPEANAYIADGQYAAHTRALNTGSIGISMDAMAGAKDHPFRWGNYPLTEKQVDSMCREVANLCDTYDIPVSKWTTLTHAEVQPTLGVRQRWKWDITVLPGMNGVQDPIEIGNILRKKIRAYMNDDVSAERLTDSLNREASERHERFAGPSHSNWFTDRKR